MLRKRTDTADSRKSHSFRLGTFTKPTFCDVCSGFIWGLFKQGYECEECFFHTHKACSKQVSTTCTLSLTTPPNVDFVTELYAETKAQSREIGNLMLKVNPALSVQMFIKQNNRYVARQGPIIWLNESIIHLITWKNVPHTLVCLLVYIILCLNPILLFIVPHLIVLYFIARFYYHRADLIMNGQVLPELHVFGTEPNLNPGFEETKLGLQSIQNQVMNLSNLYDVGYNFYRMIDWSDPDMTTDILNKTLMSMGGVLVVLFLVPINYLFLFGGVGLFVGNTAFVKAASKTLAPALLSKMHHNLSKLYEMIHSARNAGADPIMDVVLFENQRWWAGAGWIPYLLPTERKPWSDESGRVELPSKDLFTIPTIEDEGIFEWIDKEWVIDYKWNRVDTDGFEYYNQVWMMPTQSRGIQSYTRRRKWIRRMKLKEEKEE